MVAPGSSHPGAAASPAPAPSVAAAPPAATVQPPVTTAAPSPSATGTPSPSAGTTSFPAAAMPSGVAAAGDGPQGDAAIQAALTAQYPSDLPAGTADQLAALARAVWSAETTGTGRERWPGYFPPVQGAGGRPYLYTGVRVQAAIAHTVKGSADRAAVDLLWVGTSPTGEYGDHRPATVVFTRVNNTWEPQR